MSEEPYKPILDRDLAIKTDEGKLVLFSSAAQRTINYSTWIFQRCLVTSTKKDDDLIAIHCLHRHIILMADAIEVLTSKGCIEANIPLMRSEYESYLYLLYILENDDNCRLRSLTWYYDFLNRLYKYYGMLLDTDKNGKLNKEVTNDIMLSLNIDSLNTILENKAESIKNNYESLNQAMQAEQFAKIRIEIDNILLKNKEKGYGGRPKWYSLFGGPKSIESLSHYLELHGQYELLYREWSAFAHGQDFMHFFNKSENELFEVNNIRSIHKSLGDAKTSLTIMELANIKILEKFRPGEMPSYAKWLESEMAKRGNIKI